MGTYGYNTVLSFDRFDSFFLLIFLFVCLFVLYHITSHLVITRHATPPHARHNTPRAPGHTRHNTPRQATTWRETIANKEISKQTKQNNQQQKNINKQEIIEIYVRKTRHFYEHYPTWINDIFFLDIDECSQQQLKWTCSL